MQTTRLVARLSPRTEAEVRTLIDSGTTVFCRTDAQLLTIVQREQVSGIVWELSREMPPRRPGLPAEVIHAAQQVPLLIHTDANQAAFRDIVTTTELVEDLRITLSSFGDLTYEVKRLVTQQSERDAEQVMIRRLGSIVPGFLERILLVAVTLAKRRATVSDLAQACGSSRGMLHYRLRCLQNLDPRDLLGECTVLHVAWRRGVLGWTSKRTALATGYAPVGGSTALDHFVRHRSGITLREMTDPDCFWRLLERSAIRLTA